MNDDPKGRRGASAISLMILPLVLVASGCSKGDAATAGAAKAPTRAYNVTAIQVTARPLTYAVDAIGSLEAYQVVTVPARVEGALDRLDFDEGGKVTPDTVLAVIDERRYGLVVEQAKAAVTEARAAEKAARAAAPSAAARTARVKAELDEAEASLARWTALRAKDPGWVAEEKLVSVQAQAKSLKAGYDEAVAGEKEAEARIGEAEATIQTRLAAVAIAAKNVEDTRVRSPIAGVVQRRHVAAGQYVKVGDAVATLVDTSRLRLRFTVGESESVRLAVGQVVAFRVKAFAEREFKAELFHVDATADPTTRMVECLASIERPETGLRPGFFASVRIEIARSDAAIVVPEGALLATEQGFVAFAIEDGKAVRRPVTLGLHTADGGVEILAGLTAGEKIALRGAQSLTPGVPVKVTEESP